MGLFSSEKKINVFSTAAPLIEPDPYQIQNAVLFSVLSGESLSYGLLNLGLSGFGISAKRIRSYAKSTYTLGLPSSTMFTNTVMLSSEEVATVIATDLSLTNGVLVEYSHIPPLVFPALVFAYLNKYRGFDGKYINTYPSEMYIQKRHDYKPVFTRVTIADIELEDNPFPTTATITYEIYGYCIVYNPYTEKVQPTIAFPVRTYSETIALPSGILPGEEYLVASFYKLDSAGNPLPELHWWFYQLSSNKYPNLNPAADLDTSNNTMPIIPLRYHNSWIGGSIKNTGTKLLRKMHISWDELVNTIATNPNIAEIDHAYVMFGINLQTTVNDSLIYLIKFFDYIHDKRQLSSGTYTNSLFNQHFPARNVVRFNDGHVSNDPLAMDFFTDLAVDPQGRIYTAETYVTYRSASSYTYAEHGLVMELRYRHITSTIKAGVIGEIGIATKTLIRAPSYRLKSDSWLWYPTNWYDRSKLILRQQISPNAYKEIVVTGLLHTNRIYGRHSVYTALSNIIDDGGNDNFIIPMHCGIADTLTIFQQNTVYMDSLHLVLNSYVITTVRWYQRGIFKFLLMVVAFVITIYTGQVWITNLVTAIGAGTVAILKFVLWNVLVAVAVDIGMKFVAKLVGPEVMAILAIAVMIIAWRIAPGVTVQVGTKTIPVAQTLLTLSSSMMSASYTETTRLLENIAAQYDEFLISSAEDTARLEAAQELLEQPDTNVFTLLNAQTAAVVPHPLSSDPEKFFDVTVHIGNIGTKVLDIIPNYVDMSLTLPKVNNYAFGISPSIV